MSTKNELPTPHTTKTNQYDASVDNDTSHDYVYILVRTDIPLEQQTVQAIHAGMIATQKFQRVKSNTHLVLLAVQDQRELKHWLTKLVKKEIPCEMFFEPDNDMGYSALATDCLTPQQGMIFQKLPLWYSKPAGSSPRRRTNGEVHLNLSSSPQIPKSEADSFKPLF